jgi:hypothetical protein
MFALCRHIKSNGDRCKAPAMTGHAFCYYHSRSHAATRMGMMDNLYLPPAENASAIQIAVSQTIQAMLCSRISPKQAGLIFLGLQIAAGTHKRPSDVSSDPVLSTYTTPENEELAPELCIDNEGNQQSDCSACPQRDNCDHRKLRVERVLARTAPDEAAVEKKHQELIKQLGPSPLLDAYFKTNPTG